MSELEQSSHEEVNDTLLAARERIEHLTICGAALQDRKNTLERAIHKLHQAKGRYHTQNALCDLFELCGLSAERPKK